MNDRHEKWTPVEPGYLIPAGQPYRVEWAVPAEIIASERVSEILDRTVDGEHPTFVDSSWKPPLVLPSEPTWGIALTPADEMRADGPTACVGRWQQMGGILTRTHRDLTSRYDTITVTGLLDFIPLTPEQIERIEAMP